jgi:hypothetical protein
MKNRRAEQASGGSKKNVRKEKRFNTIHRKEKTTRFALEK